MCVHRLLLLLLLLLLPPPPPPLLLLLQPRVSDLNNRESERRIARGGE